MHVGDQLACTIARHPGSAPAKKHAIPCRRRVFSQSRSHATQDARRRERHRKGPHSDVPSAFPNLHDFFLPGYASRSTAIPSNDQLADTFRSKFVGLMNK
jgi:hypothetical protein